MDMGKMRTMLCRDLFQTAAALLGCILAAAPFAACWYGYYMQCVCADFAWEIYCVVLLFFLVIYILFGRLYDAFAVSIQSASELIYGQLLAVLFSDGIIYIVICILAKRLCNIVPGMFAAAAQLALLLLWLAGMRRIYFHIFPAQRTAVIYDLRPGLEEEILKCKLDKKYSVVLVMDVRQCLADLDVISDNGVEAIFLGSVHSHDRNVILKYCMTRGIEVYTIPRIGDVIMSSARPNHMLRLLMLKVDAFGKNITYLLVKRVFDIALSLLALIVLSPVFCVTAIAIKATDGGPVFYRQVRLTKNGKEFKILKFRSMRTNAEHDGIARLSTGEKDDRITPVGHVIRKLHIDEFPQLLNILKGDLSICGPRPERPEIAAQYCEKLPEFALRLQVKAGLTGYAQVYGKYNTNPYDKLQMDLMYIAHASIAEDLRIIFATVKVLFLPESTEGVSEGTTTAMEGE